MNKNQHGTRKFIYPPKLFPDKMAPSCYIGLGFVTTGMFSFNHVFIKSRGEGRHFTPRSQALLGKAQASCLHRPHHGGSMSLRCINNHTKTPRFRELGHSLLSQDQDLGVLILWMRHPAHFHLWLCVKLSSLFSVKIERPFPSLSIFSVPGAWRTPVKEF